MSRRTCANRSGSLAGCVAESIRIFCHTTWIQRHRTLTPYFTLLFICLPLFIFFYIISRPFPPFPSPSLLRRHSPPLRFLLTLPLPSTHALILNPPDNLRPVLFLSLSLSLPPLFISPFPPSLLPTKSSTPSHVYKRSLNTKSCVLRHSHSKGRWQGPRHYQPKTSKLLGL
jgi:hypothetical protein